MNIALFGPFDLTQRRGNSIRILLQAAGLQANKFSDFKVYGYKTPPIANFENVGRNLVPKMLPVFQKLRKLPADLTHTHHFYGAMVLRQKYIIDLPSIISPQISAMYQHNGPLWKKIILKRILNPLYIRNKELECIKNAAAVIVASVEIRQNLEKIYGLNQGIKYYTVNNTVDIGRHKRSELRNFLVGLSASDFNDSMDAYCLEILYKIAHQKKDIEFRVAGRISAVQLEKFRALENVRFLGQLNYEQYIEFLKSISVFLMPYLSFYDFGGSKFKLLEAGASGVPIISSDYGAIGFDYKECLCLANDINSFIARLDELKSYEKRLEYGNKIYSVICQHYNHIEEAKKLIGIYQEHCK